LANAADVERDALIAVEQDAKKKRTDCDNAGGELRDSMQNFLYEFTQLKTDLSAQEDKVGDFLQLMNALEKEKLPEAEARFVRLMNASIQKNMALLDQKLRESVEEYKGGPPGAQCLTAGN
jgi:uncharacterized protein YPO0396